MDLVESIRSWLAQPYKGEEMDATGWFLFFGLLIAISAIWGIFVKKLLD